MRWQDMVFTGGSLVFLAALIPMLRATTKPPLHSTIPVAAVLYIFSFTYLTLHFVLAPTIEFVQATMWAALAWQERPRRKPKPELCPPWPHSHNGIGQCGTDPATW